VLTLFAVNYNRTTILQDLDTYGTKPTAPIKGEVGGIENPVVAFTTAGQSEALAINNH